MRTVELHFPNEGVNRRLAERRNEKRGSYPCPWAVNVRVEDPFDRRLRGGSRPGLTKYSASDFGTSIADIISVDTSSASGSEETLVVLVDSLLKTGTGGTATSLLGYMLDTAGDTLTDDAGNRLLSSSVSAPATGFLVPGKQQVFAVGTSAIVQMNPKSGQVDNVPSSKGTVPTSTTFGAVYRDRLCLAGEDNAVYMSRQGDYSDWDYGRDVGDQGRAVAFQLSLGGNIGPHLTAMIAHKDSTMILASARTLWILRGDPTTGQLQRVSENVGIVSSRAWCKVDDSFFFLSETGVHQIGADGSNLSPVSENSVPAELRAVDPLTTTVLMEYEHDRKCVHIYLVTDAGSDTHWTYELVTQSWWPFRFSDSHSPVVAIKHQDKLLLGGTDGYIREFGGADDDGTDIESHVILGPMRMGTIDRTGIMNMLHGILAAGSGTVTWRIVVGEYAEQAADNAKLAIELFQAADDDYEDYVKHTDTWIAGRSRAQYPRVSAPWVCVWLQSTDAWSMEGATCQFKLSGRIR